MGLASDDGDSIGAVRRFGRYTLFKKLAVGGMAEIWLARQSGAADFSRLVVIKKILNHLTGEQGFREMFLDEARTCAALTHPNIVQVYDLGETDNTYFIAMELVLGESLTALSWEAMKRGGPVPVGLAARIVADACKALDFAHRARGHDGHPLGIIHRDVSPQNILLTYDGDVKVIDFGIAKTAKRDKDGPVGELQGKLSYMSPEQAQGHDLDPRSDVFALGVVLYELCTGRRLFKHDSELMVLEMIVRRRVPPPSELVPHIPGALDVIVARALAKDPAQRYDSARDLQVALEGFIREYGEQAGHAELGAYVRGLFADKAEEKRRLCDQISRWREPPPAQPGAPRAGSVVGRPDASPPGDGVRRRVVHGRPPEPRLYSQVHAGAVSYPGQPVGSTPATAPFTAHDQLHAAPDFSWMARAAIALAVVVMALAGGYLFFELRSPAQTLQVAAPVVAPPVGAVKLGRVGVDSEPSGAVISVNGSIVRWQGQPARTPILQLENLLYGTTYTIELLKDGYEPASEALVMGAQADGRRVRLVLKPIKGR